MSQEKIEEAKRLVSGLVKHQRESDNRMNNRADNHQVNNRWADNWVDK